MKTRASLKIATTKECQLVVLNSLPGVYLLQLKDAAGKVYATRIITDKVK